MDEAHAHILKESKRILSKLHLLVVFFANDSVHKIYLRSQVLHQLFEENPELDINSLELFHVQFTSPLIDLLKSIKYANEKKVSLLEDEVRLNEELIERLNATHHSEGVYRIEMPRQSLKMKKSLKQLYTALSEETTEYPFSKNIHSFSTRFATSYYYNITTELLSTLTRFSATEVYSNVHAIIQKKLMGLLCKHDFNVEFAYGLLSGGAILEVYKILPLGTYFIFFPQRNLFLICDELELQSIKETQVAKKDSIIPDLMNSNDQLRSKIALTKVFIPQEVQNVLAEHYHKIADINFLENITNFDAQVNILKTMLNTKII